MSKSSAKEGLNSPMEALRERAACSQTLCQPSLRISDDKFWHRKKVVFTPNAVDIYDMQTNSRVATGEVNHQFRLYTFSEFIEPDSAYCLLMLMKVVGYGTKGLDI
jgi:hypothetical protein